MSTTTQVKVCGLTNGADAELAVELGCDFLGFIFYRKSPRAISPAAFRELRPHLSAANRVYVQVRPDPEDLRAAADEGFEFFQLHFSAGEDLRLIEAWAEIVSPPKLWLAPKIAPGEDFPEQLRDYAETFLIDTYRKESFGGTGETGDWTRFREWSELSPDKRWVLAGGLKPENIVEAIRATGAGVVDVSSGIEERPGKKDHVRMRAFFAAVKGSSSP
ncbi:MAG: phosphoribosylanthranilate isomerase [Opitutales bacterium]